MSGYRVSKIVCPSCRGTGSSFLGRCQWCEGRKRMSVEDVPQWAEWIWTIAVGGYAAGDHDYEHMLAEKSRVLAACRLAGVPAPDADRRAA